MKSLILCADPSPVSIVVPDDRVLVGEPPQNQQAFTQTFVGRLHDCDRAPGHRVDLVVRGHIGAHQPADNVHRDRRKVVFGLQRR